MLKGSDSGQTTPFAITLVIYNQILNEFGILQWIESHHSVVSEAIRNIYY